MEELAYLLKYDSVYGRYDSHVETASDGLILDAHKRRFFHEKDSALLPWGRMQIDVVLECTGHFTRKEQLEKHLQAGSQRVLLSAPAKSEDVHKVVYGVNHADLGLHRIISCASCTTNCITPIVEIVGRHMGVKKAMLTTGHAHTGTQAIVDGPHKKPCGAEQEP
jgi:glyceraldehyde 3-phosphate dehydrogenase